MSDLETYELFISPAWEHNADYYRLRALLDSATNFNYKDHSVFEPDSRTLRSGEDMWNALTQKIRTANCVLMMTGTHVDHRDWINVEISLAQTFKKPIIAINPESCRVTLAKVQTVARVIVEWDTESIVDAIREYST